MRVCEYNRTWNVILGIYPIPHNKDFIGILQEKQIFATIDLEGTCHQILVAAEHMSKTAITMLYS